jgi:hypothetical protein
MTTFCHTTCDLEDGAVRQLLTPSQLETLATVVYRSLYDTVHDFSMVRHECLGGDGNRSYLEGGLGIDGYHPVELAFVL